MIDIIYLFCLVWVRAALFKLLPKSCDHYEEMKDNPLAKLTQILEFAGLSVDIEAATRSVEQFFI